MGRASLLYLGGGQTTRLAAGVCDGGDPRSGQNFADDLPLPCPALLPTGQDGRIVFFFYPYPLPCVESNSFLQSSARTKGAKAGA